MKYFLKIIGILVLPVETAGTFWSWWPGTNDQKPVGNKEALAKDEFQKAFGP